MNINRITQLRRLARKTRQVYYGRLLSKAWNEGKLTEVLRDLRGGQNIIKSRQNRNLLGN